MAANCSIYNDRLSVRPHNVIRIIRQAHANIDKVLSQDVYITNKSPVYDSVVRTMAKQHTTTYDVSCSTYCKSEAESKTGWGSRTRSWCRLFSHFVGPGAGSPYVRPTTAATEPGAGWFSILHMFSPYGSPFLYERRDDHNDAKGRCFFWKILHPTFVRRRRLTAAAAAAAAACCFLLLMIRYGWLKLSEVVIKCN